MISNSGTRLRAGDGRLRAWLRILIVFVVVIVATTAASAVAFAFDRLAVQFAVSNVAGALVAVAVFVAAARWLDRRSVPSYGLSLDRRWWSDCAAGLVIGVASIGVVFLILVAGAVADVDQLGSAGTDEALWTGLVAATIAYIGVGVWEELIFRGYVITNAADPLSEARSPGRAWLWAVLISAVVFAAGHPAIFTSQAPVLLAASMFLLMGGVLGAAYVLTGRLGLPIGLHIAFNLTGNRILPVTELPAEAERQSMVVRATLEGPGWLIGQGGLPSIAATALAGLAVLAWVRVRYGRLGIDRSLTTSTPDEDAPVNQAGELSTSSR